MNTVRALCFLFALGSLPVAAQSPSASRQLPLASLLSPDGTLRLNESSLAASIDPSGYRLSTGPGGEPRFLPADAPDSYWDPRCVIPGTDGEVKALAVSGGTLYIGGTFFRIGNVITSCIARWDGSSWAALGSGVNGAVNAIAVSGGDVYAGGAFTTAGGAPASHVARWDGSSWNTLGTGIIFGSPSDGVLSLAADGTDLYVGGHFTNAGGTTVSHIARWDGSAWSALGTGMNNNVSALLVAGGDLYAAGYFTSAGGGPANYVAKWDGGTWSTLSFGLNGPVLSLAAIGTDIFAGGYFTVAGVGSANHIARWDGSAWFPLGAGTNLAVFGLAASGSDLYAAGLFTTAGVASVDGVAKWSSGAWSAVGSGTEITGTDRNAVAASGSDIYVGGSLGLAATAEECNVVQWVGGAWSSLPGTGSYLGMSGPVRALAGSGGSFVVGGMFSLAGEQPSALVAYWDGSAWHRFPGLNPAGTVNAVTLFGGALYVGGSNLDGVTHAGGIMMWNSSILDSTGAWVTPSGASPDIDGTVYAMMPIGSELYVGGNFTDAGGVPASNIAVWDGSSWSSLGSGITGSLSAAVFALGSYAGELYVGGNFTTAGGVAASRIAKWSGSFWFSLGNATGSVLAFASDNTGLYAAGLFTSIGVTAADRIARWDGSAWHPLGAGIPAGTPRALAVNAPAVYVGGQFSSAGGVSARNIAVWNGVHWSSLGSGVDTTVYALTPGEGGVWAGGNFATAGGASSYYLAGWGIQAGSARFSARSLSFGAVSVGASSSDSLIVENAGADSLRIDSVAVTTASFSAFISVPGIGPHGSASLVVAFAPDQVGPRTGSVIVYHGGFTSPDTVSVSGTGGVALRIVKLRDGDGSPATSGDQTPYPWSLSLYRGSVAPANLVAARDSSELTVFVTEPGSYIFCEADSAAPWRRVNGNLASRDTLTVTASAVADTFVNYKPNKLLIASMSDADGQFGTSYDRAAKTWHLEIRSDSAGGTLTDVSESGALASGDLLDGTYYIREADSASYLRLGTIVDGVSQAGEDSVVVVVLSGGMERTVTFVNAPAGVGTLFRSVSAESLALDRDNKGKVGKRVARKPDKVEFKFSLVAGASPTLALKFSMDVAGVITRGTSGAETLAVVVGKAPLPFTLPVGTGETIQVSGFGVKGKPVAAKYGWGGASLQAVAAFVTNQPRLPMPNRVNLLAETFEQGGFLASGGLLVGRPKLDSVKNYGWLQSLKYTDVIKSLSAKGIRHAGAPKGLNFYLTGKPVLKAQKSLPPTKYDNVLLADMIALKVNIAASALGKTPPGFGELVYDEGVAHLLAGMTVREIAAYGDSLMMGRYISGGHLYASPSVFLALDTVVAKINRAFEGPLDTSSFAAKLLMPGTRSVRDISCLKVRPGSVPARIAATEALAQDLPAAAALYQNYPNPFNPTTVIRFEIDAPSLVTLAVYNVLGQEVARLFDRAPLDAGETEAEFDAGRLASGVYLYRLTVEGESEEGMGSALSVSVRKMVVLR